MDRQDNEFQIKLEFISRTICHAKRACRLDRSIPRELKTFVYLLSRQSSKARKNFHSGDPGAVRRNVERLAHLSERAQSAIHPAESINYDVKSAVILSHIEISALRHQID